MARTASALVNTPESDTCINKLFSYFDRDNNGFLEFSEVAAFFKQLAPAQSTESAANAAVEALLLSDSNGDRQLDRAEFEQLLVKISNISDVPLLETASKLLAATQQPAAKQDNRAPPPGSQVPAGAAEPAGTATTAEQPPPAEAAAAAADVAGSSAGVEKSQQLLALFEQWDRTGDGLVSFAELCQGLAKFKCVSCKKDVVSLLREASRVLALHDTNSDHRLDFEEFCMFISSFMDAAGYKLEDVLEELLTIAATKPDSVKLQQVLNSAQTQIEHLLSEK